MGYAKTAHLRIPLALLARTDLTIHDKVIWAVFDRYSKMPGGKGAYPGMYRVSREVHCARSTVQDAVGKLVRLGLMKRKGTSKYASVVYETIPPDGIPGDGIPGNGRPSGGTGVDRHAVQGYTATQSQVNRYSKQSSKQSLTRSDERVVPLWPYPLTSKTGPSIMRLVDEVRGKGQEFAHDSFARDMKRGKQLVAILQNRQVTEDEFRSMVLYHQSVTFKSGSGYSQTWVSLCSNAEQILGELRRKESVSTNSISTMRAIANWASRREQA